MKPLFTFFGFTLCYYTKGEVQGFAITWPLYLDGTHIIPTKSGNWRIVYMTKERHRYWYIRYHSWYQREGYKFAGSKETWK